MPCKGYIGGASKIPAMPCIASKITFSKVEPTWVRVRFRVRVRVRASL